jgi:hypothetical protein
MGGMAGAAEGNKLRKKRKILPKDTTEKLQA